MFISNITRDDTCVKGKKALISIFFRDFSNQLAGRHSRFHKVYWVVSIFQRAEYMRERFVCVCLCVCVRVYIFHDG